MVRPTRLAFFLTTLLLLILVAPVAAQERPPDGELEHTVGLDPNTCGTMSYIEVAVGTTVYHCYTFTNTGDVPLSNHTLIDSEFGVLLQNDPTVLQPGDDLQVFESEVVQESHAHQSFWTASAPYLPPVVAEDGVTIVVEPTAVTVGDGPAAGVATPLVPGLALAGFSLLAALVAWNRRRQ